MVSVKAFIPATVVAMISTVAHAADLAPPPYQYQPPAPVVAAPVSGWYLRGDVGVGVQHFTEFDHSQTNATFV